tara:strand:- start:108 stop:632 length:525 start_codon:yes stop_codon:yes gene_type:complete
MVGRKDNNAAANKIVTNPNTTIEAETDDVKSPTISSLINMEDWGEIALEKIDSRDFWRLIDELINDNSGFYNNRSTILEAYKNGNLWGLRVNETDKMYERKVGNNAIFVKESRCLLPCFCVRDENNVAIIIWTHTRARRNGFARKLLELLKIESAWNYLPDSVAFWEKCNIKIT